MSLHSFAMQAYSSEDHCSNSGSRCSTTKVFPAPDILIVTDENFFLFGRKSQLPLG